MKCSVGSSTWMTLQPEAASCRSSRFIAVGHVPDELLLIVQVVLGRVAVEEERQHLGRAGAEFDRLARGGGSLLGDAPDLGVFQRVLGVVLDFARHARPAPGLVNGIQHRAHRVGEQRGAR